MLGDIGDPAFASKLKNSIKPTIMKVFAEKSNVDMSKMEYVLEFTLSAMIGIMSFWFRKEEGPSTDELIKLIHQLMEDGVTKHLQI